MLQKIAVIKLVHKGKYYENMSTTKYVRKIPFS